MSALSKVSEELKQQIKRDYLTGMEVWSIAQKYGFKHPRTIYFHLSPLSPTDKVTHAYNKAKKAYREEENNG